MVNKKASMDESSYLMHELFLWFFAVAASCTTGLLRDRAAPSGFLAVSNPQGDISEYYLFKFSTQRSGIANH